MTRIASRKDAEMLQRHSSLFEIVLKPNTPYMKLKRATKRFLLRIVSYEPVWVLCRFLFFAFPVLFHATLAVCFLYFIPNYISLRDWHAHYGAVDCRLLYTSVVRKYPTCIPEIESGNCFAVMNEVEFLSANATDGRIQIGAYSVSQFESTYRGAKFDVFRYAKEDKARKAIQNLKIGQTYTCWKAIDSFHYALPDESDFRYSSRVFMIFEMEIGWRHYGGVIAFSVLCGATLVSMGGVTIYSLVQRIKKQQEDEEEEEEQQQEEEEQEDANNKRHHHHRGKEQQQQQQQRGTFVQLGQQHHSAAAAAAAAEAGDNNNTNTNTNIAKHLERTAAMDYYLENNDENQRGSMRFQETTIVLPPQPPLSPPAAAAAAVPAEENEGGGGCESSSSSNNNNVDSIGNAADAADAATQRNQQQQQQQDDEEAAKRTSLRPVFFGGLGQ